MNVDNSSARSSMFAVLPEMPEEMLSPPYELRDEISWIDFSGTENPFGMPQSFNTAIVNAFKSGIASYLPDREAHTLRSVLARSFGMPVDAFLVGSTVSNMITAIAQSFAHCTVGVPMPCPVEYILSLSNAGHDIESISSPNSFVTPPADIPAERGIEIQAALLANPSYPTSRLLSRSTLLSYLDTCDWVIVDERSIELTLGGETMVPLVRDHKNLIVVQSFSEQYAMSGVHVSYCVAHPETISFIRTYFDNTCVSMFAEVLAEPSALEHPKLDGVRGFLDSEIPWMQCMLSLIPGIDIFPAEANYVMCTFHNGEGMKLAVEDVEQLSALLQLEGFLVRKLTNTPGLKDESYFCVAVRTRQDNEKLIAAIRNIICPSA